MENVVEFISGNYVWFLTISIILLLALIGYIVDTKRNNNDLLKKTEEEIDEQALENLVVPEGKSLAETVSNSKHINSETKSVELTDASILDDSNDNN